MCTCVNAQCIESLGVWTCVNPQYINRLGLGCYGV
jgi:hypothetical protein